MKAVVITGAAGGLGKSAAELFAARGFQVYGCDLASSVEGLAPIEGIRWVPIDVTDQASIDRAAAEIAADTDGLDAVVNFAGIMLVGAMIELPIASVQRLVDVNLWGPYRVNQAFFPLLRARSGRIVNISSETGWQSGGPFNGAYAASKHAVEAYTDSLRRELSLLGMYVVKVQPGPFKTNMVQSIDAAFRRAIEGSTLFPEVLERVRSLAVREEAKAHSPTLIAEAVYKAVTATRPRAAYSVKPDLARSALDQLPTRLADSLLKKVLEG